MGLFVTVAADFGSIPSLLNNDANPQVLQQQIDMLSQSRNIDPDGSAGQYWFKLVTDMVQSVVFDDGLTLPHMQYSQFGDAIYVSDFWSQESDGVLGGVVGVGSIVVHESSHAFTKSHIDCVDGVPSCDRNIEGSYGIQARWLMDWLAYSGSSVEHADCLATFDKLESSCAGIYDGGNNIPCSLRLEEVCP